MNLYRLVVDGAITLDPSEKYIYLIHVAHSTYMTLPSKSPETFNAGQVADNLISSLYFNINENDELSELFVFLRYDDSYAKKVTPVKLDLLAHPNYFSISKHPVEIFDSEEDIAEFGRPRFDVNPIPINYNVSLTELTEALLVSQEYLGNFLNVRWEKFISSK